MNEVEIPIRVSGLGAIKAELKALKGEIANATDPADVARLSQAAGELSDKIKDANEAVAVFSTGSKFEQVSNGLGGIKQSLMSLDFEEAAAKSKTFATALGSVNPKELAAGMGNLTKTVTTMGGAFMKLGAQILMNPIFLLAAVIIAIVAAVALVLNKFGLLQGVIDALMMPVNALIAGFEMLTDWMGLTDNAGEARAKNEMARMDAEAAAGEARMKRLDAANKGEMGDYDRKIALAKAEGKSTVELQRSKIKASIAYQTQVIAESQLKLKQIYLNLQELQTLNIEDDEKRKRQLAGNKAMAEARGLIVSMGEARRNSFNDLKVIDAQELATQREKVNAGKKGNKDNKTNLKEQLDDIKAFNAEKLKLASMIANGENNAMENGIEKEKAIRQKAFMDFKTNFLAETVKTEIEALDKQFLAKKITEEQYNKQLEDLKLNAHKNLTAEETILLTQAQEQKKKDMQQLQVNEANNAVNGEIMILDAKFAAMQEGTEKELLAQAAGYEKLRADALANTTLTEEQKKALIAVYNEQKHHHLLHLLHHHLHHLH